MTGIYKKKDAKKIFQSVRKDSYWEFFKKQIESLSNPVVVELGCGSGDNAILSQELNVKKYYCIDGSKDMLDLINVPVEKSCLDLEKSEIPKCDLIISKFFFHHIKNKKRLLKNCSKALKKRGRLVIIDKFPRFIPHFFELIWNLLGIKKQLGKHNYTRLSNFKKIAENDFLIKYEKIKPGKKLKNFFVYRVWLVLEKKDI